jgi:hypothetical protein
MIHGSWHGGWAWRGVERQLSEKGHRAEAPTLPGHGPGAMRKGVSHQDCSAASFPTSKNAGWKTLFWWDIALEAR